MNDWLDRGLFMMTWVGTMWIVDALTANAQQISFAALMFGAASLALVGLIIQAFRNTNKERY